MGDGRAEGSSAIGDRRQTAISLMPDIDAMHVHIFGSLQLEGLYIRGLLHFISVCFAIIKPVFNYIILERLLLDRAEGHLNVCEDHFFFITSLFLIFHHCLFPPVPGDNGLLPRILW